VGDKQHFETQGLDYYDRPFARTACGATTKRRTTSHDEVSCLQCKATEAFKTAKKGPSEKERLRARVVILETTLRKVASDLSMRPECGYMLQLVQVALDERTEER